MPAVATVFPLRSPTPLIPDFRSQIIEVSGWLTSAAIATTSSPFSWASTTSGS